MACGQILCECDLPICAFVSRVEPSFWGNRPVLDWQTDAQKSQSGLFVLFDAHSWQPILAAQHRVATDAPVGAIKIGPILRESLCHVSCLSSPGARLNANRWAAVACEQIFVWVKFTNLRVCSARRAVILAKPSRRLIYNQCTRISTVYPCFVWRSFVATNSGSPTPPCNRRPLSAILLAGGISSAVASVRFVPTRPGAADG